TTSAGSFVCTVNLASSPVALPTPGTPLLASTEIAPGAGRAVLPADSAVWWAA
ncbi:DUF3459 domain-containing protein, partial [Streptomyces sp. SID10116]|nr:DUF3459 domain-containing protein [Streptomyces sp. SID10116]